MFTTKLFLNACQIVSLKAVSIDGISAKLLKLAENSTIDRLIYIDLQS